MKPIDRIIPWTEATFRNSRCVRDNHEQFHCLDCGVSTHSIREYYMIQNHLWDSIVKSKPRIVNFVTVDEANNVIGTVPVKVQNEGMLCIGCLETRLGRQLTHEDFTDCPVNLNPAAQRSVRLQMRMMSTKEKVDGVSQT